MADFSPIRIYHELRRRRLVEVAIIYAVTAWGVIGACDLLLPQWVADPDTAIRYVFLAALLIAPIALVFGWLYDVTSDGIQRTPSFSERLHAPDTTLKRSDHLVIGSLSTIVLAIIATSAIGINRLPPAVAPPPENSVAVLPFEVCEGQEADKVLASGLALQVIIRLAERGKLKVIARASSFAFAGFDLPASKIAEPLGVRYVLTGVVCRDGDTLTLDVELFDEDDFVVWSHSYDEVVDPAGQIKQTLAVLVAEGVAAELGDVVTVTSAQPVSRLAYEQLVIGWEYEARGDDEKAGAAFARALELQPDFAEAVFALALLELDTGSHMTKGTGIENAWPLGERALEMAQRELEEGSADFRAHFVTGRILHWLAYWDRQLIWRQAAELGEAELAARDKAVIARFVEAENHFRAAIALNPSEIDTYTWLANNLERQGVERREEALEILEQGVSKDPFNAEFNQNVAKRWAARGRYRQAIELLERFNALPEVPTGAWWTRLEIMKTQTYWDEKCELLIEMLLHDPDAFEGVGNYGHLVWFPSELAWLGLYEEAEAWYLRVEKIPVQGWAAVLRKWFLREYRDAMGSDEARKETLTQAAGMSDEEILNAQFGEVSGLAWTLGLAGEYDRAIRLMESIQHSFAWGPFWAERQAVPRLQLVELYQKVGRDDDAAPLLEELVNSLEAEFDSGIRHPQTLGALAETYARQGRDEAALDMLRKAVDYHWRLTYIHDEYSVHSPWENLRDDPRFIALMDRVQTDLDQQAERIRAMLAEHDIDELLAPVMALAEEAAAETEQEE